MMPRAPVFDPRDQQALLAELLARVPGFAAAWKPSAGEPGWALLSVYARYLEILGEELTEEITQALARNPFFRMIGATTMAAWRGKAQSTVDNALMRYFIIHAHKLLDPATDDHEH